MTARAVTVPPHLLGSSGDLPRRFLEWPGLPGVQRVEAVDGLQAIDILSGFPRRAVVTRPLHQVLELLQDDSAIPNGLRGSIRPYMVAYGCSPGRGLDCGNGVGGCRFPSANGSCPPKIASVTGYTEALKELQHLMNKQKGMATKRRDLWDESRTTIAKMLLQVIGETE